MSHKKRKLSKINYMCRNERKAEQEYQKFQKEIKGWKKKNAKNNFRIITGFIFHMLYFISLISVIILVFKDTTMQSNIHNNVLPLIFFLGWILLAGIFCFSFRPRNRGLQEKVKIFVIIANIFMYAVWGEIIFFSPVINMLCRIAFATVILIIMVLASHYLLHKIWRCPACGMPLPISEPGYHVLIGMPVDCTVCPHCKKAIAQ